MDGRGEISGLVHSLRSQLHALIRPYVSPAAPVRTLIVGHLRCAPEREASSLVCLKPRAPAGIASASLAVAAVARVCACGREWLNGCVRAGARDQVDQGFFFPFLAYSFFMSIQSTVYVHEYN
jgi:hypothetical protein